MAWLIDSNVLSELRRKRPDGRVSVRVQAWPRASLLVSVLTLGEIRKGIEAVADGTRKQALADWLEQDLRNWFLGRVLGVDAETADCWGRLVAAANRPVPAVDSLLAATAVRATD